MSSLTCPTPEDLARWVNDGLDPVQRAEIGTHVDTCNRCQWAIEELTDAGVHGLEGLGQLVPAELPHEMSETTGPAAGRDETADREHERRRPTLPGERADPVNGASDRDGDSARAGRQDRPKTRFTIPSYDILEEIGTGGMGVVYKARQRGLNRLVALKMIRGSERRATRPARAHSDRGRGRRPAPPPEYRPDLRDWRGRRPSLPVAGVAGGGTLDDRLAGNPQPGRSAAELMATLARAIQMAHDAKIIHRDLKPSNVLFDGDGIPKITDFGLAKRLESDSRQTESGQIMGTPCYMAPEQAMGHTREVGPAADIYSLGAILYEMLTGRPPFKGETADGDGPAGHPRRCRSSDPPRTEGRQRPGNDLPALPEQGAGQALSLGPCAGRGSRAISRRQADQSPAHATLGTRIQAGQTPPRHHDPVHARSARRSRIERRMAAVQFSATRR